MSEMTITENTSVEEIVNDFLTDEIYTPYGVWKIIKLTFETTNTQKTIPSQMMYNYARNGLINGQKGVKKYSKDEVREFVVKYVKKFVQ